MPQRFRFPALALLLAFLAPGVACAGPPYLTDDPVPTDLHHWEIYTFASGSHTPGTTDEAAGLDFNYGGAKDLQLTAVFPLAFQNEAHGDLGNIELAAKYRFVHQKDGTAMPDVAVFPRLFVPSPNHRYGSGRLNLLLPLWVGKDFGPWSVFGGGGITINPGHGNRNFWQGGLTVTRAFGEALNLGVEVYHRTPDARDAEAFTGVNLGAVIRLAPHWSLLASGGPGIQHARAQGQYDFYVSLKADY